MPGLRYEAWPVPGTVTPYEVKVRELPVIKASGNIPTRPMGRGGMTLHPNYQDLPVVTFVDPVDHSNDVSSLIRVFRPDVDPEDEPFHEFLTESPIDSTNRGPILVGGRNVEAVLDREVLYPFDWDGTVAPDDFISTQPDHIYGGKNLLRNAGFEDGGVIPDIYTIEHEGTGGTYTLTVGATTTVGIAFNAGVFAFETALETALNTEFGIVNANVFAVQQDELPLRRFTVTYSVPGFVNPPMTANFASLTPLTSERRFVHDQDGEFNMSPWTKSMSVRTSVMPENGTYVVGAQGFGIAQAPDPVLDGTNSGRYDGLSVDAGMQQVVEGLKPGGVYFMSIAKNVSSATNRHRLTILDIFANVFAATPFPAQVTTNNGGWALTDHDQQFTLPISSDGTIIYRHSYLGEAGGADANPAPVYLDRAVLSEGLAPTTAGQMLLDLYDDAQTDHAPVRAALLFVIPDFDAVNDTNGVPWIRSDLKMNFRAGTSYLGVMRQFEKLGYQWRLRPNPGTQGEWLLQVYNPGTVMGTNHSGLQSPSILVGGGTVAGNVNLHPPAGNVVLARGIDPFWSLREDAASLASDVGRIVQHVDDKRIEDAAGVGEFADASLAKFIEETLTAAPVILEPNVDTAGVPDWPRPMEEYTPGDVVDVGVVGSPTKFTRTIVNLAYIDDADGLRWPHAMGDGNPAVTTGTGGTGGGLSLVGAGNAAIGGEDPAAVQEQLAQTLNQMGYWVNVLLELQQFRDDPRQAGSVTVTGGGGGTPTIVVASNTAPDWVKAMAHHVCTGTSANPNDQLTFYDAFDTVFFYGGGRIVFSGPQFFASDSSVDPNAGFGSGAEMWGLSGDITYQGMGAGDTFGTVINVEVNGDHSGVLDTAIVIGQFGNPNVRDITFSVFPGGASGTFEHAVAFWGLAHADNVNVIWSIAGGDAATGHGVLVIGEENMIDKLTIEGVGTTGAALVYTQNGAKQTFGDVHITSITSTFPAIYFDPGFSHSRIHVDNVYFDYTAAVGATIASLVFIDSIAQGTILSNFNGVIPDQLGFVGGLYLGPDSQGVTYHGIAFESTALPVNLIGAVVDLGINHPSDHRMGGALVAAAALLANPAKLYADTTTGAFVITLPDVVQAKGCMIEVTKATASANALNLTCLGADLYRTGVATQLFAAFEALKIYSDGVVWHIINRDLGI